MTSPSHGLRALFAATVFALLTAACPTAAPPPDPPPDPEPTPDPRFPLTVQVTIDGGPAVDTVVSQGGLPARWTTDPEGLAVIEIDTSLDGEHWVIASHPEARQSGVEVPEDARDRAEPLRVALTRFDPSDNPAFTFRDPGEPDRRESTAQCAHCHLTITEDWVQSPHKTSASNPLVHDLYAGVRDAADAVDCASVGGVWRTGTGPGTGAPAERCYIGEGVLPALNPDCGDAAPCDEVATSFGGCADCHAPGIDGQLGGRDLLEATGLAYDYGVHCDVCHRTESVDLAAEPGVAGRLDLVRPSEPGGFGQEFLPLVFGPFDDVPTPVMGAVARSFFHQALFCAGCHEQDQPALVPGQGVDLDRWPAGRLPIHSTYSEWLAGPMNPAAPCHACHMPPDPEVENAADRQIFDAVPPGVVGGWVRPPGAVRKHAWYGPRQPESGMLQLAAALFVAKEVVGGELVASVTTRNVGPGHAIPTGEPLRSLILTVEATCDGAPLEALGGDVVPDYGGAHATKVAGEDWTVWPEAQVGQMVRVVQRPGGWVDYVGHGPFGDGTFSPDQKGVLVEELVGESRVDAVDAGVVTLSAPLPAGDVAYLVDPVATPLDGEPARARAGAPGFGFARVLADAAGRRMVPHFLAVDVVSDNRLLPQAEWTSTHRFATSCAEPIVRATLVHRAVPLPLAAERGWALTESVMAEVVR